MKAVFAITSKGNDYYTAMTRVAVSSLRLSNPKIHVVVAFDQKTEIALKRSSDPLIDEVDDCLVIETPQGNAGFRNRFVKTSLRANINGPFLFLDSDIFVRGDLTTLFSLETDIAGARNHSRQSLTDQIWDQDIFILDAMGWIISKDTYINGGVLFYNDSDGAKRLGEEWHKRWLRSYNEQGNYRDQPALNSAIHEIKPSMHVLSDRYNAQIKASPSVAWSPIIWHYYSSAGHKPETTYELFVNMLMCGKPLLINEIKKISKNPHPWRRYSIFDDIMAKRVISRDSLNCFEGAWLRRKVKSYIFKYTKIKLNNFIIKYSR